MQIKSPFIHELGYVASRENIINGGWVVVYQDRNGFRVVCKSHSQEKRYKAIGLALQALPYPEFCTECNPQEAKPSTIKKL